MKKITLILIISVLFFFVSSAAVIAQDPVNISGVYEMIARGNGLISTKGFEETAEGHYVAKKGSRVWGTIDMAYATWVFKDNGTGTADGQNFAFDLPPGPRHVGPKARDNAVKFQFDYTVTIDGTINVTITEPPGLKPLIMEGMVSEDLNTITLHSEYVFFNPNTIFMASRVLIRVSD